MKNLTTVFCIYFSNLLIGQTTDSPFKNGEWLRFKVQYGIFNASMVTLSLEKGMYNGEKVYHAIGRSSTTDLAHVFFRVGDVYESYFGINDGKPRLSIRSIYEGGYTKYLKMYFNHTENKIRINNVENGNNTEISFQPGLQDVISALYVLRHYPGTDQLRMGEQISLDMILDDDGVYKFKLRLLGREQAKTNFGTVNTLKFCPLVQDGRVFKEEGSITVWITDDKDKIPVKPKAALRVGPLIAGLNDFNSPKHEINLKK